MDKTKDEYEFEKGSQDCTFQPNINKDSNSKDKQPHYVNQRSIQNNLDRMKKAREERDFKKKMTERGYGEPNQSAKPAKKPQYKRPTDYSRPAPAKKVAKASSKATAGGSVMKQPAKGTLATQNANKRRTAAQRNMLSQETESSKMKKASKAETQKEVRVNKHKRYEEQPDDNAERMYREIEEEEKDIREREDFTQELQDQYQDQEDEEFDHQFISQNPVIEDEDHSEEYIGNQSPEHDEQPMEGELSIESPQPNDIEQVEGEEPEGEGEGNPLLFVDVNLGPGRSERIVVYEGDTAENLADDFTKVHGLDGNLKEKLVKLLENQIAGLLARIDEELTSNDTEQ
jgi:hypothetical protein